MQAAANFTYSGSTVPAPVMPVVWSVLRLLKLSANGTGGTIAAPFSLLLLMQMLNQQLAKALIS